MTTPETRARLREYAKLISDPSVAFGIPALLDDLDAKDAEIAALKARVAELEGRTQWRPIETAPKDGTRILGSTGGKQFVCRWEDGHWTVYLDRKDGFINKLLGAKNCWLTSKPTHWQPLLTTPAGEKGEG